MAYTGEVLSPVSRFVTAWVSTSKRGCLVVLELSAIVLALAFPASHYIAPKRAALSLHESSLDRREVQLSGGTVRRMHPGRVTKRLPESC